MSIERPEWISQMEGILETLNEGVLIVDDCDVLLFANDVFLQMIGMPAEEVLGRTPARFYNAEEMKLLHQRREAGLRQGKNRFEFSLPAAGGSRVPVVISSRVLEDPDGREFSVLTFTDITAQKQVEQRLKEANEQLARRAEEMERELQLASRVQQSLAPAGLRWGRITVDTHYAPVRTLGGDFGLVAPSGNGHLILLVSDVTGHGISSALIANRIYTETMSLLKRGTEVGELLRRLNLFVVQQIRVPGFYFTMAAGRVNEAGTTMEFASGGHPPALWVTPSGEVRRLESQGTVLGLLEDAMPPGSALEVPLSPRERVVFYTDGLIEVWNNRGEELGITGFEEIVRRAARGPFQEMKQAILSEVEKFRHGPSADDISLVVFERE
jgi:PAS domain S-box-containing protein